MADNLYEKFGSREIVDLMLERIDTVKETYESRRNFSASSILKGALTRTMVYPLDETGAGAEKVLKLTYLRTQIFLLILTMIVMI